jgi:hypothetical protein
MDGPDRNAYEPIAPRGHESAIHSATTNRKRRLAPAEIIVNPV